MKSRDLIVAECVGAFQACYQHYSDVPLDQLKVVQLQEFTDELLPKEIPTEDWQRYTDNRAAVRGRRRRFPRS